MGTPCFFRIIDSIVAMHTPSHYQRLAMFLLCCLGVVTFSSTTGHASQNQRAPDFALQGANGKVHSLASYVGKPLVLYFMTFSCRFCKQVEPQINRLHLEAGGRYAILGAVLKTPVDKLLPKKRKRGIRFPLAAGDKALQRDYRVRTTPTFWLIDAKGRRKEVFRGVKGADLLVAVLERESTRPITGLVELLATPQRFTKKEQTVAGILRRAGRRGKELTRYYLTNTKNRFYVTPWLPEKSTKGNFLTRGKPGMDAMIAKSMFLTGKVVLKDGKPVLQTRSAKTIK